MEYTTYLYEKLRRMLIECVDIAFNFLFKKTGCLSTDQRRI